MTYPEQIRAQSTWWERLLCRVFGHNIAERTKSPDRPPVLEFCWRCGHEPDPAFNRLVEAYWRQMLGGGDVF